MDLTTAAAVKAITGHGTTDDDALIGQLIASVSGRVEAAIARHVEQTSRTETMRLEPGGRLVLLAGYPVTTLGDVLFSDDGTFAEDALTEGEDFRIDLATGAVRLLGSNPDDHAELRVTYTGGMAADTAAFMAAYPGLSGAVGIQVVHEFQRRLSPGGSQTFEGGGIMATGALGNLPLLDEQIDIHRRVY